jgi:hypothetical protein
MELENIKFSERFNLLEGQKQIIKDIIEWRNDPPLCKTGRSSYLMITDDSHPFKGIKIKGCGYFDLHENKRLKPSPTKGYEAHLQNAPDGIKEIHYQIEIDENDEPYYSTPKKRPYGAQLYKKAKLEFDVNKYLIDKWTGDLNDFPFYLPLAYAKYKDIEYFGDSLGVTVLGMPMQSEKHLGSYFEGNFEENGLRINPHILSYWQKNIAVAGSNNPDYFDLFTTLKELVFKFGRGLSYLHEHFADFDSHLFNTSVDDESGRVLLFDFDHVFKKDDISAQKYFYLALKDFEIGLVAVLSNLMLSGLIEGLVLFEKLDKSPDDYNILEGFYEGYFGSLNKQEKDIVDKLWQETCLFALNKVIKAAKKDRIHLVYNFCETKRNKSYYDIFDSLTNKLKKSNTNLNLDKNKHKQIIDRFLEKRKELEKLHKT